jgi:hypothetical protein
MATLIAGKGRARDSREEVPRAAHEHRPITREGVWIAIIAMLVIATLLVARMKLYTAGSDLGYALGLAGGIAMALLFLYPLRKRWRALSSFGKTRFWFALHMILGIVGPLLIVLHSTLRFGSINATVAFACMSLVAASGVVGRFLYVRIHHGLYGRRASLAELRAAAGSEASTMHSRLSFAPEIEARLAAFGERAARVERGGLHSPWHFFTLGFVAAIERRRCNRDIEARMRATAIVEDWPAAKLRRRIGSRKALVAEYLRGVVRVAQFHVFERLFSWWHVLHVPLVYMLVMSAIAHVVAVHMY